MSVSEEEVDAEVKHLQDRYADWVLREEGEPAQIGDQVTIDFVGEKMGSHLKAELETIIH